MPDKPEVMPQVGEMPSEKMSPKEARELIAPDAFSKLSEDKRKMLIEAAVLLVGLFVLKERETADEGKKAEDAKEGAKGGEQKQSVEKPVVPEVALESKKKEIDEKLKQLEGKGKPYLPKIETKERVKPEGVYYVGDSYMQGVTNAGHIPAGKKNVASGRPLLPRDSTKWAGGNDVESIALRVIREDKPKLLVINGGLNDFYMNQRNPGGLSDKIIESYGKIIDEARKNGVKLVICDVPQIPLEHANREGVKAGMDKVNGWLSKQTGVQTVNTAAVIDYEFRSDETHPTKVGYKKLSDEIGTKTV